MVGRKISLVGVAMNCVDFNLQKKKNQCQESPSETFRHLKRADTDRPALGVTAFNSKINKR